MYIFTFLCIGDIAHKGSDYLRPTMDPMGDIAGTVTTPEMESQGELLDPCREGMSNIVVSEVSSQIQDAVGGLSLETISSTNVVSSFLDDSDRFGSATRSLWATRLFGSIEPTIRTLGCASIQTNNWSILEVSQGSVGLFEASLIRHHHYCHLKPKCRKLFCQI